MALGAALFANGQRERGLERMRVAIDIRRQIGDEMGFGGDICEYAEAIVAMKSTGEYPWGLSREMQKLCDSALDKAQQPVRICYVLGVVLEAAGDAAGARKSFERGQEVPHVAVRPDRR